MIFSSKLLCSLGLSDTEIDDHLVKGEKLSLEGKGTGFESRGLFPSLGETAPCGIRVVFFKIAPDRGGINGYVDLKSFIRNTRGT